MVEMLVEAQNLRRVYQWGENSVVAVDSATFAITSGARIALMGPSGSGKSTLLYLMGGLDTPTFGKIAWTALGDRKSLRPQKIAFVFQMPSLLAPLNVVENVSLPLLLGNKEPYVARIAAMEVLERIGLSAIADKMPEELSGGQAQRVAVARALVYRPRLILADEPTGQLDRPTAKLLLDVLLATLEGTDTALVVATHDRAVAERLDSLWYVRHGNLLTSSNKQLALGN
ncbi:ABC transporter ATP-binding protein [Chroococcidiopsis sp. CCALA 051]|uniref:ABC transporter ATP-binding protein n=1 Tax=Chroococcidiopsis sp. CCALA 051 TaxID=869949 RepID=UPI000D0E048C|nr:ABC transporter ATP-binding protein [Chroococcidiopsis sp. CCALA 051]PSM50381.1 ABC transporter ATP-binding protein [Chroococcidiopsis sp. CCALA 051]